MIDGTGRHVFGNITTDGKFILKGVSEEGYFSGGDSIAPLVVTSVCQAYFDFRSINSAPTVATASCYLQFIYNNQSMMPVIQHEYTLSIVETTKRFTMTEV